MDCPSDNNIGLAFSTKYTSPASDQASICPNMCITTCCICSRKHFENQSVCELNTRLACLRTSPIQNCGRLYRSTRRLSLTIVVPPVFFDHLSTLLGNHAL